MRLEKRQKKRPVPGRRRRLPRDFVCIAPKESRHVFEFMNGTAHDHEKEIAKLHFHLCLHCQEIVAGMQLIKEDLNDDAKELLHQIETHSASPVKLGQRDSTRREDHIANDADQLCMKAAGEM